MLDPNYIKASDAQKAYTLPAGSLEGRVILITGATGGLGTCLSKICAAAGGTVVLASRNTKKLEKLYDVLEQSGAPTPAIIPLEQDKAGPDQYGEIADVLSSEMGGLDALVHCSADLGTPTPQINIEHTEWTRVMHVNLNSARLLSLYCLPLLMQSSLGSLSFLLDHKPRAYWGGYGVSKTALLSFMQMLSDEMDNKKDRNGHPVLAINGYDPGPMRTPLRRKAFPGELETQSVVPDEKTGPLLALMNRDDRSLTGAAICYPSE